VHVTITSQHKFIKIEVFFKSLYFILAKVGVMLWVYAGNLLVSKGPLFKPILLDFDLAKNLSFSRKQALVKMFLTCAEVFGLIFLNIQ
jgi:hypothetical protein